jgi:hypothetical protein
MLILKWIREIGGGDVDCIYLANGMDKQRAAVDTVLNLPVL